MRFGREFYARKRAASNLGAVVLALVSMAALTLLSGPAAANPTLQKRAGGVPCGTCHQQGREDAGRAGLTPYGNAFMQNGYNVPAAAAPVGNTTETVSGYGSLKGTCSGGQRWVKMWMSGQQASEVLFVLPEGSTVRVFSPVGTLYVSECNRKPQTPSRFITLD